jgi:uncharacterized membrane protein
VEKHKRSVAKAISWRAAGTVDTFVISWPITGSGKLAGGIASVEVVTKMGLYYLHERAWSRVGWGRSGHGGPPVSRDRPAAVEGPR